MLEAVERIFEVVVVKFEVGEFELERVVLSFEAFSMSHHSVIFRPRDNVVVTCGERQQCY